MSPFSQIGHVSFIPALHVVATRPFSHTGQVSFIPAVHVVATRPFSHTGKSVLSQPYML